MVRAIFILRAGNSNVSLSLRFTHVVLALEINYYSYIYICIKAPIYVYEEIIWGQIDTTPRKTFTQIIVIYTEPRDAKLNCVYDFN